MSQICDMLENWPTQGALALMETPNFFDQHESAVLEALQDYTPAKYELLFDFCRHIYTKSQSKIPRTTVGVLNLIIIGAGKSDFFGETEVQLLINTAVACKKVVLELAPMRQMSEALFTSYLDALESQHEEMATAARCANFGELITRWLQKQHAYRGAELAPYVARNIARCIRFFVNIKTRDTQVFQWLYRLAKIRHLSYAVQEAVYSGISKSGPTTHYMLYCQEVIENKTSYQPIAQQCLWAEMRRMAGSEIFKSHASEYALQTLAHEHCNQEMADFFAQNMLWRSNIKAYELLRNRFGYTAERLQNIATNTSKPITKSRIKKAQMPLFL